MTLRTLVATVLINSKGKDIYCPAKKISFQDIDKLKTIKKDVLEANRFTFIRVLSLEHPNIRGYVIFFEGHQDEVSRVLSSLY